MAVDDGRRGETFVGRWARLKQQSAQESRGISRDSKAPAAKPAAAKVADTPPPLPDLATLTFESDFTGFLHAKVDEKLRREALKTLFRDPRFNVIDLMDDDLFDMSLWEPLPQGWLQDLKQFTHLLPEKKDDEGESSAMARAAPEEALPDGEHGRSVLETPGIDAEAAHESQAVEMTEQGPPSDMHPEAEKRNG
jgi:hypothetical protein